MSPYNIVLVSEWSADPIGDEFFAYVDLCIFLLGPSQCPFPFSCETDCSFEKKKNGRKIEGQENNNNNKRRKRKKKKKKEKVESDFDYLILLQPQKKVC